MQRQGSKAEIGVIFLQVCKGRWSLYAFLILEIWSISTPTFLKPSVTQFQKKVGILFSFSLSFLFFPSPQGPSDYEIIRYISQHMSNSRNSGKSAREIRWILICFCHKLLLTFCISYMIFPSSAQLIPHFADLTPHNPSLFHFLTSYDSVVRTFPSLALPMLIGSWHQDLQLKQSVLISARRCLATVPFLVPYWRHWVINVTYPVLLALVTFLQTVLPLQGSVFGVPVRQHPRNVWSRLWRLHAFVHAAYFVLVITALLISE